MLVKPDPRMGLRALTVRQPYASEIASGDKVIEYRDWSTHYRGDLVITVAQKREPGHPGPYSVTLCLVELVDVRLTREGPEWLLANARALPQVAVKGALKLWPVSAELAAQLGLAPAFDAGHNVPV